MESTLKQLIDQKIKNVVVECVRGCVIICTPLDYPFESLNFQKSLLGVTPDYKGTLSVIVAYLFFVAFVLPLCFSGFCPLKFFVSSSFPCLLYLLIHLEYIFFFFL